MALAVDIIHGHGPSNKMHRHLQPDKSLYKLLIEQEKAFYTLYVTSKAEL